MSEDAAAPYRKVTELEGFARHDDRLTGGDPMGIEMVDLSDLMPDGVEDSHYDERYQRMRYPRGRWRIVVEFWPEEGDSQGRSSR